MKRLIFLRNALLFCLPAMLLAGCEAASGTDGFTPRRDEAYEMDAAMEYGEGQSAQLHLTRWGEDLWEAEFSEPATLSGVILTFDGDAVTASYKGLEFSVPKSALPAKNMLVLMTDALDQTAAAEQPVCSGKEDGTWCYAAECAGGSFTVTFAESGEPLSFELPAQPLKVTFSAYTVTAAAPEPTAATLPAETEAAAESTTAAENNEGTSE